MKIDKTFIIDAPQDEVWQFVSCPEKIGMCFPGCENITALGENKYKATIKVQIGPIKTVFKLDFEATENRPPEFSAYTTRGEEANRASRMKADSTLSLSSLDDGRTQVVYTSDLSIVGRLGKFGLGVMRKKADSMGDEFAQTLRMQIEGRSEATPTTGQHGWSTAHKAIAAVIGAIVLLSGFYFLTG